MSSVEQFGYREQLSRALGTRDLIVYGMIFMVPIAPYSVFGFVWNDARGMVPLAYLIGLVGMVFTAMSYAAMSRAFPLAGSVYTYAQRGLHDVAGFFAGWLILLDYILIPALLVSFQCRCVAPVVSASVPAVGYGSRASSAVQRRCVNLFGIEFTARVNRYMLFMELVTLVHCSSVLGLAGPLSAGRALARLTLKPRVRSHGYFPPSLVVGATSIAVLSFLGLRWHLHAVRGKSRGARLGRPCDRYWSLRARRPALFIRANVDRNRSRASGMQVRSAGNRVL